ncbi:unnamed protein product [Didymodactylos carnosus]|uniref:Uncharacterized protein n=1 Tax=Didymodactylos carnosus TaxID=1234261 RepID=A0A815QLN2_9BILA|nr:unnamed protein product [Didymodactylos carnosus]CAF1464095.1 unnamed protein product [Didymodactylos carnosus]CAF4158525.1 unnamed protein product [Didymodactylos carnosus]CAF4333648.1 unnamed protein product [Didymodactylos carnosus]
MSTDTESEIIDPSLTRTINVSVKFGEIIDQISESHNVAERRLDIEDVKSIGLIQEDVNTMERLGQESFDRLRTSSSFNSLDIQQFDYDPNCNFNECFDDYDKGKQSESIVSSSTEISGNTQEVIPYWTQTSLEAPFVNTTQKDNADKLATEQYVTIPPIPSQDKNQLRIKNGINSKYRPQTKHEIFPIRGQNAGKVQPSRYIRDKVGCRDIILEIPEKYLSTNNLLIKVAWVTASHNGKTYYIPYKFQRDNKNVNVKDKNPIYYRVTKQDLCAREIKIKLVCIRSLINQLESVQSLKPFDGSSLPNDVIESAIVSTTELLNEYELEKSRLAFTLCSYHGHEQLKEPQKTGEPLTLDIDELEVKMFIESTVISDEMIEQENRQRKKRPTRRKKAEQPNCQYISERPLVGKRKRKVKETQTETRKKRCSTIGVRLYDNDVTKFQ